MSFTQSAQDWESKSLSVFMDLLYSNTVRGSGDDNICRIPAKVQRFAVHSYRTLFAANDVTFPWKSIWRSRVPPRIAFFLWTAALGKILTIDNLQKRHIVVLDWHNMCKCSRETVDHLLLHCSIAKELWTMAFGMFGIYWVMPRSVLGLLACWQGNFGRHQNISIWQKHNARSFGDCERTTVELKLQFFRTLLDWVSMMVLFPSRPCLICWIYVLCELD